MFRTDGGYGVPGMPGNAGVVQPAVRFNPSDLNVKPGPGYFANPAYSPFRQDQDRDRFILHDARSGVAGNPFGPGFVIPGKKPVGQPVLPGENKESVEGVYGTPGPKPMPGQAPLGLPMAMGSSNLPAAVGNMAGMTNAQFYFGPQAGQMPVGFQGKYVS